MSKASLLPDPWRESVIGILANGTSPNVTWTRRALQDWQMFGLPQDAHKLLIRTLSQPIVWGEEVHGMTPLPGRIPPPAIETHAFLCPHPLGVPTPLYAKIGLHGTRVSLDLFSLHIDLSGELARKIAAAKRKKQP